MDQAFEALNRELDGAAPDGLDALQTADVAWLAARIGAAKQHQEEALDTAIAGAVDGAPRLLRRPVKKILFG